MKKSIKEKKLRAYRSYIATWERKRLASMLEWFKELFYSYA